MKKNKIYILLVSTLLVACGDEFLTLKPTNQIIADDYYNSEERLYSALVAAYAPLQWHDWAINGFPLLAISGVMSGEMLPGGGSASEGELLRKLMNFSTNSTDVPSQQWTVMLYAGINRCNIVIDKVVAVPALEDAKVQRFTAEAKLLRAYYYKTLWKLWGNIPYYEKNLVAVPFVAPQLKADEVYAKIMTDLDYACVNGRLPKIVYGSELGRLTKGVALMMRTEVALYQNDKTKYTQALNDMREMMQPEYGYGLMSNFGDIWTDAGEFCKESVWEVNYTDKGMRNWNEQLVVGGMILPRLLGMDGLTAGEGQIVELYPFRHLHFKCIKNPINQI
ncbi:MAG: hypothetical protein AUK44_03935 [Porphyromonadaceae bacterium CG2_30_38_12]|nr:MAG: hypothetical protein AUK44_03935 [Porphyromonadaceae bacterium CG2_30_38_12]